MAFRAERPALVLGLCVVAGCNPGGGDSTETNTQNPSTSLTTVTQTGTTATEETTSTPPTSTTSDETTQGVVTVSTSTGPDPTTGPDVTTGPDETTGEPCVGLECQVDQCDGDPKKTTLKGVVYAPEGTLPLYNITVYVPGGALPPVVEGVTCDTCDDGLPGDPIVAALTDTKGEFVLEGVPSGDDVPLVISVGKWRREVVIPTVVPCTENLAPFDLTRLPRNQSEGHIPKIAMVTGGADPLECLLRKIGVEDAEFTNPDGPGRVNLYRGREGGSQYNGMLGGADFPAASTLWDSLDELSKYDLVLMACEGDQDGGNKSGMARENVRDYAGLGGRLFLSHWHNIWIDGGADPFPTAANFDYQDDLPNPTTGLIDTSFPKGQALADWMINVGGSTNLGEMEIKEAQNTVSSVNADVSTRWVYTDEPEETVQYFTFNAPIEVEPEMQCGRVVDSDIHVSSGDDVGEDFPNGCETQGLSPQEKALVFMLFELSACLIPDDEDPIPG